MGHAEFLQLPEREQNIFITKLVHAIKNNKDCFQYADFVVQAAEVTGMFKNIKFGSEIFNNDAERDLLVSELSELQNVGT